MRIKNNKVKCIWLGCLALLGMVAILTIGSNYITQKDASSRELSSNCGCQVANVEVSGPELFRQFIESVHVFHGFVLGVHLDPDFNPKGDYTRLEAKRVWKSFELKVEPTNEVSILQRTINSGSDCLREFAQEQHYMLFFKKDLHIDTIQDFSLCDNSAIQLNSFRSTPALLVGLDLAEISLPIARRYFERWNEWADLSNREAVESRAKSICTEITDIEAQRICGAYFSGENRQALIPKNRFRVITEHNH